MPDPVLRSTTLAVRMGRWSGGVSAGLLIALAWPAFGMKTVLPSIADLLAAGHRGLHAVVSLNHRQVGPKYITSSMLEVKCPTV